ncbi:unnamed protein product [Hydatigera taeniaeformis]|uniref:Tyrosine-protein phosphatase domain-containing protein n=1 Tax=Hydatigena taeniaeformis TaxID=6205 RepID=A0A0R3X4R5_HYDTA|nr:unnamed protein product [Hydatigera taeniaeformis]
MLLSLKWLLGAVTGNFILGSLRVSCGPPPLEVEVHRTRCGFVERSLDEDRQARARDSGDGTNQFTHCLLLSCAGLLARWMPRAETCSIIKICANIDEFGEQITTDARKESGNTWDKGSDCTHRIRYERDYHCTDSSTDALRRELAKLANLKEVKWVDHKLCELLAPGGPITDSMFALPALKYYHETDRHYLEMELGNLAADFQRTLRCIIITPFDYRRLVGLKITNYYCEVPFLQFAPPLRLNLDVTSGVPNFSYYWEQYLERVGGTMLDKLELQDENRENEEENRLLEGYDCVIFHVDTCGVDYGCVNLWELSRVMSSKQILAITGVMVQKRPLTSNMDTLWSAFWTMGGFLCPRPPPLRASWRIWYTKSLDDMATNIFEIIRWARIEIIKKNYEPSRSRT